MSKRGWILLGSAIPVLALFALLGWASAQSSGTPGAFAVNSELGQVKVSPDQAAEFSLELMTDGSLALSQLRGKVVMVDFWSSWCPPCIKEAPVLTEVYREYQDRAVEFVGVAIWDRQSDVQEHIIRYGVSYPNGIDEEGVIAINYGVTGLPEKFFIDREGLIVKKFVGPMKAPKLRAILDDLLRLDSSTSAQ